MLTFWPEEQRGWLNDFPNPIFTSGWNRILLMKSCLTLYDTYYIDHVFKGGHSVSGSKSNMYATPGSYRHKHCLFCKKHTHRYVDYSIGRWFAEYFINQKKTVFESWRGAIAKEQYEYAVHYYENGGAYPATFGLYGYIPSRGTIYNGPTEKFESMYNGALWLNSSDKNDFPFHTGEVLSGSTIMGLSSKFGSPSYNGVVLIPHQ
jgi:hypothetical protein